MSSKVSTVALSLAAALEARAAELRPAETLDDMAAAYRDDPVGFARDWLGIRVWSKQRDILEAALKHYRISVCSGHKCGKSTSLAIVALWIYCTRRNARVVITAKTDRQVNGIIWREIKRLAKRARMPIPGYDATVKRAATGWDHPTLESEIRGYTASESEAIAGISGESVAYLVDEASGVDDKIFEAIEGNRAGGDAWVFLISNPTRSSGEFYDSHHSMRVEVAGEGGYYPIHISSWDSPNVTGEWRTLDVWDGERWAPRSEPIKGLAMPSWCEEKLRIWGEKDVRYVVRVLGSFAAAEEACIFPLALIDESTSANEDADASGFLFIGVDPAGEGDAGDDSVFWVRRGNRSLKCRVERGLSDEAHLTVVRELLREFSHRDDVHERRPVVVLDSEGLVGARVYNVMRAANDRTNEFTLVRVRSSERSKKHQVFALLRDELIQSARDWMQEGGGILEHDRLHEELHVFQFTSDTRGRLVATPKKEIRKVLGRSPDVADAFMLSVWQPSFLRDRMMRALSGETAAPPEPALNPPGPPVPWKGSSQRFDAYSSPWSR